MNTNCVHRKWLAHGIRNIQKGYGEAVLYQGGYCSYFDPASPPKVFARKKYKLTLAQ